jgi:hypothetical protein
VSLLGRVRHRGLCPPEATGPTCWGPRAKALAAFLMARQHLPLERCAEAMAVLLDTPIGEGTLAGLLPDAAQSETILEYLDNMGEDLEYGAVVVVTDDRIRVRRLPLLHDD